MQKIYNYLILFAVIACILYYNSVTKVEGFSLPGVSLPGVSLPGVSLPGVSLPRVSLPGVSLPTSIRPLIRRARLFGEDSVRQIEKMTIQSQAKAMMKNS
jgi:hypothetical protein